MEITLTSQIREGRVAYTLLPPLTLGKKEERNHINI